MICLLFTSFGTFFFFIKYVLLGGFDRKNDKCFKTKKGANGKNTIAILWSFFSSSALMLHETVFCR